MTRETKIGLLVGMAIILVIGILVSDHLAKDQEQEPAQLSTLAPGVNSSLAPGRYDGQDPFARQFASPPRQDPIPLPAELQRPALAAGAPGASESGLGTLAPAPIQESPPAQTMTSFPLPRNDRPQPPVAQRIEAVPDAAPAPAVAQAPAAPASTPSGTALVHYVRANETLYNIAALYYGSGEMWRSIQQANPDLVGPNGRVHEGVRLVIPHPTAEPVPAARAGTPAPAKAATITVEPGQTLSGLAMLHLGSSRHWRELLDANRDVLRSPEQLQPGMVLRLPAGTAATRTPAATPATPTPARPGTYTVKPGDTLSSIAERLMGDTGGWRRLYEANRQVMRDPDNLTVGMELTVPR
jgi:nucleoid-associated protein YgaU